MKGKQLVAWLLPATFAFAAATADLPQQWRAWRYSRSIVSSQARALNYVTLDRDVLRHSENRLGDLRIIDETGAELPYELQSAKPEAPAASLRASIRENSFVPGKYTQVVFDLRGNPQFHDALRLETPETDFINWVEVAASDDARTWRIVKERAPISRFRKENLEGSQTVRYSENNARFLRVRIMEPSRQFPVTGGEVFLSSRNGAPSGPSRWVPLTAPLLPDLNVPGPESQWTADLSGQFPVAAIAVETSESEFYRAVRILNSRDNKEWVPVAGGEIYRYQIGEKTEESLLVSITETWGPRYWRIEVLNGNDAPLAAVHVFLAAPWRYILFRPREHHAYRLLYGNARCRAPQYDFARTLHGTAQEVMLQPSLGSEELTGNYLDPRPFTERHPILLWLALAIAVLLLGYTALRTLRSPATRAQ